MKNLEKAYDYINKYKMDSKINNQEQWHNIFLLVCALVDDLGCYKEEYIKHVLKMLNEYDFEKNREE